MIKRGKQYRQSRLQDVEKCQKKFESGFRCCCIQEDKIAVLKAPRSVEFTLLCPVSEAAPPG